MTESRIARRCRTIRRDSDNPGAGKPTGDARHPLRQAIGGWTAEPAGPTQKATTGPFLHCRSPGPYRNFGMRGPVSVRVGMKGRRAQHIAPRPSGAGFGSSCTRADAPRPAGPCAPRRAPRSRLIALPAYAGQYACVYAYSVFWAQGCKMPPRIPASLGPDVESVLWSNSLELLVPSIQRRRHRSCPGSRKGRHRRGVRGWTKQSLSGPYLHLLKPLGSSRERLPAGPFGKPQAEQPARRPRLRASLKTRRPDCSVYWAGMLVYSRYQTVSPITNTRNSV